jgi:protein SCO1/2
MRWTALPLGMAVLLALQVSSASAQDRRALPDAGIDQRLGERVPLDLVFRDEDGNPVRLGQYFGRRPVVLSLVYYECPMLCTLVLNGLVSALRGLAFDVGRELDVVTVSIAPNETPALAKAKKQVYLESYRRPGAAEGWHFLTGDSAAIEKLAGAVGFRYQRDPESGALAHGAGIMVLTPDGTIARYFFGVEYSARDLRLGLVEAAERRIGSPIDQLLLLCFRYDPSMGRYSAAVMGVVRAGGVLTVFGLGILVVLMRRRERQNAGGGGCGVASRPRAKGARA